MPVTLTPNQLYIGGAEGSLNASNTDGVGRSLTNPVYNGQPSQSPASSSSTIGSEMQIDRRVKEQKASRQLFGVGVMSAIALLLAIVAIATNGGGGSEDPSISSAGLGVLYDHGASSSPANATASNREY